MSSDNYKIIGVSFSGFALFSIGVFGALFLIDRKFDLNNKLSWIISIAIGSGVALVYYAIVYQALFMQ